MADVLPSPPTDPAVPVVPAWPDPPQGARLYVEAELPATTEAARAARVLVAAWCRTLGVATAEAENAVLVASELAANAVVHGHAPVAMRLHLSGEAATLDVFDAAPVTRALHRALLTAEATGTDSADAAVALLATHGRGLRLVRAVATALAVHPALARGKTIRAVLRLQHPAHGRAGDPVGQ